MTNEERLNEHLKKNKVCRADRRRRMTEFRKIEKIYNKIKYNPENRTEKHEKFMQEFEAQFLNLK